VKSWGVPESLECSKFRFMMWLTDVSERIRLEAGICAAFSLIVLVFGLCQWRSITRAELLTIGAITIGSIAFLVEPRFQLFAAVLCAIASIAAAQAPPVGSRESSPIPSSLLKTLLIASFISIAALLLYRLGSFSPTLLTWEATSLSGLLERLIVGPPTAAVLIEYLLWVDGVLSAGERSLLFGLPAYLFSSWQAPSVILLRAISVFWMLGSVVVFALLCKRYCGPVASCVALLVFGLNEAVLLYGRYASSIAATMFSLVVSFYLFFRLIERPRLITAALLAISLFVSTLGYSPARITVLLLLGLLPLSFLFSKGSYLSRAGALLVLLVSVVFVLSFQKKNGHESLFLRARGEQFSHLVSNEEWRRSIFSVVVSDMPDGLWSPEQQYRAAYALVQKLTGPQLIKLLNPFSLEQRSQFPFRDDPPSIKIIAPALFPFLLVGFWVLWRPGQRATGLACATVGAVGAIPLLFTTRVDTYRAIFMIIPLSICITAGLTEFIGIARRCKTPSVFISLGFLTAIVCGIVPRAHDMYQPIMEVSLQEALRSKLRVLSGPLLVVSEIDHKLEAALHLELFTRFKRTRQMSDFLDNQMAHFLTNQEIDNAPALVDKISQQVDQGAMVMLLPSRSYTILAAKLQNAGHIVRAVNTSNLESLLVSRSDVEIDPRLGAIQHLDTSILTPPLASTTEFLRHTPTFLSDLKPSEVSYDFAPISIGCSYSGQPVRWRNLGFAHGIGTHATTTLVYKVPDKAEGFQSWVGISSGVGACSIGTANLIFSDQDGTRIYESPVLYAGANPLFMSIPIPNVKSLRILISNAGDGKNCDHVDFGDPAFMIPTN